MRLAVQMLLLSVLTNTAAQLSLKHGLKRLPELDPSHPAIGAFYISLLKNPFFLIWVGLLPLSMFLWLKAISMVDLSFAYPFMSLNLVFIALGSVWLLRERIRAIQWAGIFFIVSGLILVSVS